MSRSVHLFEFHLGLPSWEGKSSHYAHFVLFELEYMTIDLLRKQIEQRQICSSSFFLIACKFEMHYWLLFSEFSPEVPSHPASLLFVRFMGTRVFASQYTLKRVSLPLIWYDYLFYDCQGLHPQLDGVM